MTKPAVGIFAHPDDEAFGPGGTIAKLSRTRDVYIICATNGQSGKEYGRKEKNLGDRRKREMLESAKILGVKGVYFLGFQDTMLSNALYHKLAGKIEAVLNKIRPDTIITFEPRGVSGHLDHIAVSLVSSFVFKKLGFIKRILQFCLTKERARMRGEYFIFFPPGYKKRDIGVTYKVGDVWDVKIKAVLAHRSQVRDVKRLLRAIGKFPKEENFLVVTRKNIGR